MGTEESRNEDRTVGHHWFLKWAGKTMKIFKFYVLMSMKILVYINVS